MSIHNPPFKHGHRTPDDVEVACDVVGTELKKSFVSDIGVVVVKRGLGADEVSVLVERATLSLVVLVTTA